MNYNSDENDKKAAEPFLKKNFFYYAAIAAVLFAVFALFQRHAEEVSNKTVEITAEYASLYNFAISQNINFKETLIKFKSSGLSSVAFSEDTLSKLADRGKLFFCQGAKLRYEVFGGFLNEIGAPLLDKTYIFVYSEDTVEQIETFSFLSYPDMRLVRRPDSISFADPAIFECRLFEQAEKTFGLGFSKADIKFCRDLGLGIILRPENRQDASKDKIKRYIELLKNDFSADKFIFAGSDNDVLGYPNYLSYTASLIKALHIRFGVIESPNVKAMQKGIQSLSLNACDNAVRVMTIVPTQQKKLNIDDMVEKYSLGIRERNIRIIYIRPHTVSVGTDSLEQLNLNYISKIKSVIDAEGFRLGLAEPFKSSSYPVWRALILSFGTLSAFVLLLMFFNFYRVFNVKTDFLAICLWALISIFFIISGQVSLYRKASALVAGIVFPILALVVNFDSFRRLLGEMTPFRMWKESSLILLKMACIASAGGVMIGTLLAGAEFYIHADMFRGIKIIMALPPIIVVLAWISHPGDISGTLKKFMDESVKFAHAAFLGLIGILGGYYLLRTGNASEAAVSKLELTLRSFLSGLMIRPRLKEFLIGFPAVMCFGALRLFCLEKFSWILIAAASIGAADLTDTFAHIHTPIRITLIRVFNSVVIGWIVGSLVLLILIWTSKVFVNKNR